MAIKKYIINESDLAALLRGEVLAIQSKVNIKGMCVKIVGNLTNGDMIMAMFNRSVIGVSKGKVYVEHIYFPFDEDWWNSPYRGVSEETK